MASKRSTGDLIEIIENHSKEIRKLKRRQKKLIRAEKQLYTPELTASTTNPDLGTGATTSGMYTIIGDQVVYRFFIQFGTGSSAGDGQYRISAPTSITSQISSHMAIGQAILFDWSVAGHKELAACYRATTTTIGMVVKDATVFHNNPFNWDDDDRFGATVVYDMP